MRISGIEVNCYRIPLPRVLSDSAHEQIEHFQLITVRLRDDEGGEGVGYTYTPGKGVSLYRP